MYLRSLVLQDFRRYEREYFAFHPQINLIWGPNAIGKTTILEAIFLMALGRSFRTTHLKELVRSGAKGFQVEATFEKHGVEQSLRFLFTETDRGIYHNQTACRSLSELFGILQAVVVTPDDASLVKEGPSYRRRFLDVQISQADPLYLHHLMRYAKALKQRNSLLKAKSMTAIESWERQMAIAAAYIARQRANAVEDLNLLTQEVYRMLGEEKKSFYIRYSAKVRSADEYCRKFSDNRKREAEIGYSLTGPHKDDLLFLIGDQEVRHFASEGQQRTAVAALRIAEWERLRDLISEPPLMLYDDVGMSFDEGRKRNLFACLEKMDQVFLTSTHTQGINASHLIERH